MKSKRMKNLSLVLLISAGFTISSAVFAQITSLPIRQLSDLGKPISSSVLPGPIQDILNLAKRIGVKLENLPIFSKIAGGASGEGLKPEGIVSGIKNLWKNINDWLKTNVGVSLSEILKVLGNLFLWILQFAIDLIKSGLGYLRGV